MAASSIILPSAQLAAQGSVFTEGVVSWAPGTITSGAVHCSNTNAGVPIPGNLAQSSCNGGPQFSGISGGLGQFETAFLMQSLATANAGSLGSNSTVAWMLHRFDIGHSMFSTTGANANARARWDDVAHFAPTTPGGNSVLQFMDITFKVHGAISGVEGLNFKHPQFASTSWIGNASSTVAFAGSSQGSSFFASQVVKMGGIQSAMPAMPQFQTLRIGINGLVSNPFQYLLSTDAAVSILGNFPSTDTFTGFMDAAFANTITPVSYVLWDANNSDVTSQYGVSFENGLTFGTQQSVVPEPATFAMCGAGLLVVFGIAARKKRKHT